jgi:uncharacterized protein YecE (DUF72 family)
MIRVGTSGWSYEDWRGPFYPPDLPRNRFLSHYARHFDVAEVNSTYYASPGIRMVEGLVRRTEGEVVYCVKANRHMTHERDAGDGAYRDFVAALAPLLEHDLLGAVLAQFPQSLKPDAEGRRAVERLRRGFEDLPLVFEFRDRSWDDERVYSWMRAHGVGLSCVDVPKIGSLFPPVTRVTSERIAYMRCHGRNAAAWYEHDEAWQRYDYRYGDAQTRQVARSVRRLHRRATDVYVFYNNHYRAQAVDGATRLKQELGLHG